MGINKSKRAVSLIEDYIKRSKDERKAKEFIRYLIKVYIMEGDPVEIQSWDNLPVQLRDVKLRFCCITKQPLKDLDSCNKNPTSTDPQLAYNCTGNAINTNFISHKALSHLKKAVTNGNL